MDEIRAAALAIADAETIVAMSGAGMSTESGIPDFRSEGGLWEQYNPRDFHIDSFDRDPGAFWAQWVELHDDAFDGGDVEPNPGHDAFATLEAEGHLDVVLTQNVDGLHQAAGNESVIELHGTHDRVICRHCGRRFDVDPAMTQARNGQRPPTCDECDGVLKPDSVLFGEPLPEHALLRAHAHAESSDVFIVAGSSLTVEPAASLPATAAKKGATLIIVNADPTPHDGRAEYVFRDNLATVLPALVDELPG